MPDVPLLPRSVGNASVCVRMLENLLVAFSRFTLGSEGRPAMQALSFFSIGEV